MQMKFNYHTHTERCFHAHGSDEDFVLAAMEAGFAEVGFADHTPWNFEKGFVSHMRMTPQQLPEYAESIRWLGEKYKNRIELKVGLECEYFPKYLPWLQQAVKENGIDYLILGHHFDTDETSNIYNGSITTPQAIYKYRDDVLAAMETGLFLYIAHPDLYMRAYPEFDAHCEKVAEDIIAKAIETDTPLEYNLLGLKHGIEDGKPGYPHPGFWEIAAEMKPKAVIGIDAHTPEAFFDARAQESAARYLASLGIETVKPL